MEWKETQLDSVSPGLVEMDDELENFIREQKARVAADRARLEQDPPYMEMKSHLHRGFQSTLKENIPPNSHPRGKEEGSSVGLPLGLDYERKKQRLQHELRMDYQQYLSQSLIKEEKALLPEQPGSSHRDAAALTRGTPDLRRLLPPAAQQGQQQLPALRNHIKVGRGRVEVQSEEDECSEEVTLMGEERMKRSDTAHQRRALMKSDRRDEADFITGLIIGAAETEEALQRKKELYRRELQQQIAEQHRNRRREKELELRVAATGANDPEKKPDRIRQFGLGRRKNPQVPPASESVSIGGGTQSQKTAFLESNPLPQLPLVAFQSPLLEYSSALGLGEGLSPNSQPAVLPPSGATDQSRLPVFPPHPPPSLSDSFRNFYPELHYCHPSRAPLEPHHSCCAHLSVPCAGLPMSCWSVAAGGAVPSQLSNHSPQSQCSGGSFLPDQPTQSEAPQSRTFPSERSRSARERNQSYRDSLREQEDSGRRNMEVFFKIRERQERRRLEREERERYEARLEADMRNHQPWGRGGGGAPLKDSTGNLIADLNQMHKLNEEAYINPEQWQRRTDAAPVERQPPSDPNERVSGFTRVQTPQFARGNVFADQPSQQQLQQQDKYKAYLQRQIEEKLLKKAEERKRTRLEEEKEEKRLEEQRARIQREYEEEQEKRRQKEREQKAKNEELIQQAEERRKEAERKRKEAEEREKEELRRQYEKESQARLEELNRNPSPPVPTLQRMRGPQRFSQGPPTVQGQRSTAPPSVRTPVLSHTQTNSCAPQERSLSGLRSPPVPARRTQLRAAGDQWDVFSELSALRRQLRTEQKRLESRLQHGGWEDLDSPLSDRHQDHHQVDVFDMARLRLQAPVRRPNSRTAEPKNLPQIHDSLQLKDEDAKSRSGSVQVLRLEGMGGANARRRDYRSTRHLSSRGRQTADDDLLDLSQPLEKECLRSAVEPSDRGSLLESESEFIDPLGHTFPVPSTPEVVKSTQLSARERRRLVKQSQLPQDGAPSSQLTRDSRDHSSGSLDQSDGDLPPRCSSHSIDNNIFTEASVTDSWLRPGTSETLRCLRPLSRRERAAAAATWLLP